MSSKPTHKWRVHVKNLETNMAVGIYDHEKTPQRLLINALVEGEYPALPAVIEDCFNYEHIHNLVINIWAKKSHTSLLEECVTELLAHIFRSDERVSFAKVSVEKPDIFVNAEAVGVETAWTREDFLQICFPK